MLSISDDAFTALAITPVVKAWKRQRRSRLAAVVELRPISTKSGTSTGQKWAARRGVNVVFALPRLWGSKCMPSCCLVVIRKEASGIRSMFLSAQQLLQSQLAPRRTTDNPAFSRRQDISDVTDLFGLQ